MKIIKPFTVSLIAIVLIIAFVLLFPYAIKPQFLIPESKPGITVSWQPAERALTYQVKINNDSYPETQGLFLTLFKNQIPDSGTVTVRGFNGQYGPPSDPGWYKFIPDDDYEPPELPTGDIPLITTGENYDPKWQFYEPGIERINYYVYKTDGIATKIMLGGNPLFNGSMYSYVTFQENAQYRFVINWQYGTSNVLKFRCGNIERMLTESDEFILDIPAGTHRVSFKPSDPSKTVYIRFPITIDVSGTLPPEKVQGVSITF